MAVVAVTAFSATAPGHRTQPRSQRAADRALAFAEDRAVAPAPEHFDAPPARSGPLPDQLRRFAAGERHPGGGVWALIVGIDDYPGTRHDLRSAVADADTLDQALDRFGVAADRRVVLRDRDASAAAIGVGLDWLVANATADATAVFLYAGHARRLSSTPHAIVGADGVTMTDVALRDRLSGLRSGKTWIAMGWETSPTREHLLEICSKVSVTVSVPIAAGSRQGQLAALAMANVVGRLPLASMRFVVPNGALQLSALPYRGATIHDALEDVNTRLELPSAFSSLDAEEFRVDIATPSEHATWLLGLSGSAAYFGRSSVRSGTEYDPVGCYTLACMVGGEVMRACARAAAADGAGVPGSRFAARVRPATDRWLDFCGASTYDERKAPLPPFDWVSCGAVNQAALAVLSATPEFDVQGTVFDPGILDPPDLNRSLLSFAEDIGLAKAEIGARALGSGVRWHQGRYPEALARDRAPWIVCGTDDPSIRPACQSLWPDRLIVTATEGLFGYTAWHSADRPDAFCGACQPAPPLAAGQPIATSAPTSVAVGTAAAALIRRLASGGAAAHRTDILTFRLDSSYSVEESDPRPTPGCAVCERRTTD